MSAQDDFYIGYQDKSPASVSRVVKRMVIVLFVLIPLVALVFVTGQKGFSTGTFELGNITELKGIVCKDPYPHITIFSGKDMNGQIIYQDILLVGYGKFGAEGILGEIEERVDKNIQDVVLTLTGTLIYNDGKTLFELTKKADSYISHSEDLSYFRSMPHRTIEQYGTVDLQGEVIDPKCYFGIMKPGEGKPHRSCAIRCISGGIPPMLAVKNDIGESNYYILLGPDFEPVNSRVLDYVADQVNATGTLCSYGDWLILLIDPENGLRRIL